MHSNESVSNQPNYSLIQNNDVINSQSNSPVTSQIQNEILGDEIPDNEEQYFDIKMQDFKLFESSINNVQQRIITPSDNNLNNFGYDKTISADLQAFDDENN